MHEAIEQEAMALTFRISNIPSDISKSDIERDLKVTFPEVAACRDKAVASDAIILKSLSRAPSDPEKEQIAIVTFNPVPLRLKEPRDQLQIRMKRGKPFKAPYVVCFDSHFVGLTPLNEVSGDASFE